MTGLVREMSLATLAVAFAACAGESGGGEARAASSEAATEVSETQVSEDLTADESTPEIENVAVNPLMNPSDPEMNHMAPATFRVRLDTSKGEVVLELHRAWAPLGVDRFYNLVRAGFYDGVRFFRVLDGFMAQFGINGDPRIQARWRAANIPDDPLVEGNSRGRLTFAKTTAPNSRSTQLFINYEDNSNLDPMGFSAIGEVVEGMEVVDELYSGYGEGAGAPDQGLIRRRGNEYLISEFPDLDYIESAEIIGG